MEILVVIFALLYFSYIIYPIFKNWEWDDSLISREGWKILNDPVKRVKLREMIDNYHKTGIWDFKILEDEKSNLH